MPEIPEDLDVFRRPHFHLKQLVKDIEIELHGTNFLDSMETHTLLAHLLSGFREFKSHEEIENQYIVKELLPRLSSHTKATLENDIHSSTRLSDLVTFMDNGLQLEWGRSERERVEFGNKLKETITDFNVDFIPHMDEEEKVFLPLLLEHFSESELRDLTLRVLELHQLHELPLQLVQHNEQAPSLVSLPPEVLLQILSYLSPRDLLKLAPLHSTLKNLTFDPTLWEHLHPVRWAAGHWEFFRPPLLDDQEMLSNGIIEANDVIKELLSAGTLVNANLSNSGCYGNGNENSVGVQKEMRVLRGVVDHLLPQVGGTHVQTLDLSYGKAISNEVVFRLLRCCPNLVYLDLSYTKISDFAFRGLLSKVACRWKLEYVDISGCHLITDTALQKLAQSLAPPNSTSPLSPFSHVGGYFSGRNDGGGGRGRGDHTQLKCLILSGCNAITDEGLRSLALTPGALPYLCYLNLSGLPNVTHRGLTSLVAAAPTLSPELLFYCDNILAGPYSECANGCQNIGSTSLQCCRLPI